MCSICLIVGKTCGEMLTIIFLSSVLSYCSTGTILQPAQENDTPDSRLNERKPERGSLSGQRCAGIRLILLRRIKLQARNCFRQLRRVRVRIYVSYPQHTTCLPTNCTGCRFLSAPWCLLFKERMAKLLILNPFYTKICSLALANKIIYTIFAALIRKKYLKPCQESAT